MGGDVNRLCLGCMQYTRDEKGLCPHCGAAGDTPASPHHLAPRTVLNGKYLAARVLGEGGFGITYLGWDINLETRVAIKEYYPVGAVTRNTTASDTVSALGGNTAGFFDQGRERFVDEARRLARFSGLPGIVAVKGFFYENGTAYIVMEFIEGITLKETLDQNGGRMQENAALALMQPLIGSLAQVHRGGVIHRDISPDNIMLTPGGALRLIDFGAARDFEDDNKSLSVLLKPGYAPEEQYRSRGRQGPWTDVYALSATIFRAIEGTKPPESMERMFDDTFAGFTVPVSERTRAAIMRGLAVRAPDRWQSMEALYAALYTAAPVAAQAVTQPGPLQQAPGQAAPVNYNTAGVAGPPLQKERKKRSKLPIAVVAVVLVAVFGLAAVFGLLPIGVGQAANGAADTSAETTSTAGLFDLLAGGEKASDYPPLERIELAKIDGRYEYQKEKLFTCSVYFDTIYDKPYLSEEPFSDVVLLHDGVPIDFEWRDGDVPKLGQRTEGLHSQRTMYVFAGDIDALGSYQMTLTYEGVEYESNVVVLEPVGGIEY